MFFRKKTVENESYYETLGLRTNASKNDIKNAYRKLVGKYHPDRANDGNAEELRVLYDEVVEAYGVLSDLHKRREYDIHLGLADDLGDSLRSTYGELLSASEIIARVREQRLNLLLWILTAGLFVGLVSLGCYLIL